MAQGRPSSHASSPPRPSRPDKLNKGSGNPRRRASRPTTCTFVLPKSFSACSELHPDIGVPFLHQPRASCVLFGRGRGGFVEDRRHPGGLLASIDDRPALRPAVAGGDARRGDSDTRRGKESTPREFHARGSGCSDARERRDVELHSHTGFCDRKEDHAEESRGVRRLRQRCMAQLLGSFLQEPKGM